MGFSLKLRKFFSDRIRLAAILGGFLLGLSLFFNSGSISKVLIGASSIGILFGLTVFSIQNIKNGKLRSAGKVSGLALILLIGGAFFFLDGGITCMRAVYSVDYNSLDGSCQVNTYTCNVDRPWYMSECSGENLEDFCERKNFGNSGVNEQDLNDEELRRQKINEARREAGLGTGYRACKEAGFVE